MNEESTEVFKTEGVPPDYVDPDLMDVRLPQPFRLINSIIGVSEFVRGFWRHVELILAQELFDSAWEKISVAGLE